MLRRAICAFLAAAFVFAAQPGTMAMPSSTAMAATSMQSPAKHHHSASTDPCKNMTVCLGLLACYGIAASTAADQLVLPRVSVFSPKPDFKVVPAGLMHPPEDPPPIA